MCLALSVAVDSSLAVCLAPADKAFLMERVQSDPVSLDRLRAIAKPPADSSGVSGAATALGLQSAAEVFAEDLDTVFIYLYVRNRGAALGSGKGMGWPQARTALMRRSLRGNVGAQGVRMARAGRTQGNFLGYF